ncbi:hypothetical protein JCM8547_003297 [Rhodosporidiobolus lusitaniae]
MKLLPLLPSLFLFSSLSLTTSLPRNVVDLTGPAQLDKRTPEPGSPPIIPEGKFPHKKGKGGGDDVEVNVDVDVDVDIKRGRPSYDWSPDDSGYGYGVDYRGYGPPSWCGKGWQWFGREIGWAPYKGWRPQPHWEPPAIFVRVWVKVSWWSPPKPWCDYWHNRYHDDWYRYGVPSHWGGWKPRGYGRGGEWFHEREHGGWWWWKGGRYGKGYGSKHYYRREGDDQVDGAPVE